MQRQMSEGGRRESCTEASWSRAGRGFSGGRWGKRPWVPSGAASSSSPEAFQQKLRVSRRRLLGAWAGGLGRAVSTPGLRCGR